MPKFPKEVFLENSHGTVAISTIKDNCFFHLFCKYHRRKSGKTSFFQNWETRFKKNLQLWKHQHFQNWRFSFIFRLPVSGALQNSESSHQQPHIQLQSQFHSLHSALFRCVNSSIKHLPPHNNPQAFLKELCCSQKYFGSGLDLVIFVPSEIASNASNS